MYHPEGPCSFVYDMDMWLQKNSVPPSDGLYETYVRDVNKYPAVFTWKDSSGPLVFLYTVCLQSPTHGEVLFEYHHSDGEYITTKVLVLIHARTKSIYAYDAHTHVDCMSYNGPEHDIDVTYRGINGLKRVKKDYSCRIDFNIFVNRFFNMREPSRVNFHIWSNSRDSVTTNIRVTPDTTKNLKGWHFRLGFRKYHQRLLIKKTFKDMKKCLHLPDDLIYEIAKHTAPKPLKRLDNFEFSIRPDEKEFAVHINGSKIGHVQGKTVAYYIM